MKEIENRGRTFDSVFNPKNYFPFSKISNQSEFDLAWTNNRDWVLANIAHAAYCDKDFLSTLFDKFGATQFKFYQSNPSDQGVIRGREALLIAWHDKAILAFRGTEGNQTLKIKSSKKIVSFFKKIFNIKFLPEVNTFIPTDILDDISFFNVSFNKSGATSKVHGGFYNATEELWPEIKNDLDELNLVDATELYVTGHSLGAAMAVIAAMKYNFKEVVTFGEPSVGNDINNTMGDCAHYRFVNGQDPVTKIVPSILYKHHGKQINIEDVDGPDFKYDHSIINYAEILGLGDFSRTLQ